MILNPLNGKVIANEREESNLSHIFAIGDVLDGKPELTPVAVQVIEKSCLYGSYLVCIFMEPTECIKVLNSITIILGHLRSLSK